MLRESQEDEADSDCGIQEDSTITGTSYINGEGLKVCMKNDWGYYSGY